MPTLANELPNLGSLDADVQATAAKLDELANQVLAKCSAYGKAFRDDCARIEADLERGVEARQFAVSLARSREYGSALLRTFARLQEEFAGWGKGMQVLAPLMAEVQWAVARLDELLARIRRPAPPIDEAALRERSRWCDEQNAWVDREGAPTGPQGSAG